MKTILWTLLLVAASTASAEDSTYLTYEDFIKQVRAGNVKTVALGEYSFIQGTLLDGASTKEFECYSDSGSASDPLLIDLLKEHDVKVSLSDEDEAGLSDSTAYVYCFFFVFLILIPIVILIYQIIINKKLNRALAVRNQNIPGGSDLYEDPMGDPFRPS